MLSSSTSLSIPTLKKQAELPPTPSSSYCQSVLSKDRPAVLDRDRSITSPPKPLTAMKQYGSFMSMPLSDDTLSLDSAPPTPPHTTISPNDDDEGLYLLWTHQMLRERGFRPSSCRTDSYHDQDSDNDDDDDDDDSSLSATSVAPKQHLDHRSYSNPILSSFTSFVSSCLCPSS
ncbi:hypothetical protein [Absidia glauca]|uniref:Uncharacterized protein n=1 Tax=Absidia glauca TaxID=4829 RepID=A0A168NGQ3_ABSGL|nr:hypothetical protein [Absidia glauca]